MATLEDALLSYLSGYAGLTTLISTRVYNTNKPQTVTYPCLVFQRVNTPRMHTHDDSGATGTLASPRFRMDAWADREDTAKKITDQVRAALHGKTGSIGTSPNNVTIRAGLVEDEIIEFDEVVNRWRSRSEIIIWQQE